ncbi:MAG: TIM barrel protein, partial [Paracoccaceae bacterium]|nr:TIM barrel protein [Paracoccaceae bacterium]
DTLAALEEVADHNPAIDIAVEYKPNEPRAHALMPDMATTLLALAQVNRPNTGVTLDFAHMLYAGEMPAKAAMLAARSSRILGLHLNDGYGKRDDGLIAGSVHPVQTVELLVALQRIGYAGIIYFDTFPDHSGLDPVDEARANIRLTDRMIQLAATLAQDPGLAAAQARQDAAAATGLVMRAMLGA